MNGTPGDPGCPGTDRESLYTNRLYRTKQIKMLTKSVNCLHVQNMLIIQIRPLIQAMVQYVQMLIKKKQSNKK